MLHTFKDYTTLHQKSLFSISLSRGKMCLLLSKQRIMMRQRRARQSVIDSHEEITKVLAISSSKLVSELLKISKTKFN